jgi:hypothetical protein
MSITISRVQLIINRRECTSEFYWKTIRINRMIAYPGTEKKYNQSNIIRTYMAFVEKAWLNIRSSVFSKNSFFPVVLFARRRFVSRAIYRNRGVG